MLDSARKYFDGFIAGSKTSGSKTLSLSKLYPPTIIASTVEQFTYAPLETDNHIRLLKVRPPNDGTVVGRSEVPFVFDLIHVSLDEAPRYSVVSHTWGPDPNKDCKIHVDTKELPITRTLGTAIPRLLKHSDCLWIDQVCINQDDTAEKGRQILLMGKIYAHSNNSTLIWMGDNDGTVGELEDLIRIINQYDAYFHFGPKSTHRLSPHPAAIGHKHVLLVEHFKGLLNSTRGSAIHAVIKLLERQWFQRGWVF